MSSWAAIERRARTFGPTPVPPSPTPFARAPPTPALWLPSRSACFMDWARRAVSKSIRAASNQGYCRLPVTPRRQPGTVASRLSSVPHRLRSFGAFDACLQVNTHGCTILTAVSSRSESAGDYCCEPCHALLWRQAHVATGQGAGRLGGRAGPSQGRAPPRQAALALSGHETQAVRGPWAGAWARSKCDDPGRGGRRVACHAWAPATKAAARAERPCALHRQHSIPTHKTSAGNFAE